MKRRLMLASGAIVLAAASAISFTSIADAAAVRYHFVHTAVHRHNGHRYVVQRQHPNPRVWVGGGWTGDNWTGDNGWMDSYYNGYGSYHGFVGDFCGTIEWTLGLCGPHGP